jgi:restriction system protein
LKADLSLLPRHDGLFWPVVTALQSLDGSADNDQLVERVSDILGLADNLTAIPHKNGPQTEISYRIAWVKTWLKWGQIVDNPKRAVWVLTERGRKATEQEIEALRVELRSNSSMRRKSGISIDRAQDLNIDHDSDSDVDAPAEAIDEFADDDWQNELLKILKDMQPDAFERLSRLLLLNLGFSQVKVVGRSGDGGIDLIGIVKVNNVLSFKVLVQCKRYKETVGPGDIRNFRGAMQGRTDKGMFITSGRFTSEARKESSRDGVPEIDLVDGESLTLLLKNLKMGVETELVEQVTVQSNFFTRI